jgi:zinc D-Ala-D-Ala carboxypeptidase
MGAHFSRAELTATSHPGLQGEPGPDVLLNLARLTADVLEPARATLSVPLKVNSGWRSPAVNRAVGGSATSAHVLGLAADVVPEGLDIVEAYEKLRASGLVVDQAIFEDHGGARWIHLGLARKGKAPREQWLAFTPKTGGHYLPYTPGAVA